jgi:DNA invertase Pin-like site-specific DNA recombinase
MAVYGYARVSTEGQTLAAQEAALHEAGAAKVFKEKISGAANHRAQLHRLLKTIDAGDMSSQGLIGWPGQLGTC